MMQPCVVLGIGSGIAAFRVLDLAKLLVIAPATAHLIARMAHRYADDYLTTVALAVTCPVLVCSSMNVHMWNHPAVQENVRTLLLRGIMIAKPATEPLACGYSLPSSRKKHFID
ncbi:MAG: hypothetical protein N2691_04500 [Patescibacteria group bacterium]|nr:hypothetical protein [Patescibacteria group bacterium]